MVLLVLCKFKVELIPFKSFAFAQFFFIPCLFQVIKIVLVHWTMVLCREAIQKWNKNFIGLFEGALSWVMKILSFPSMIRELVGTVLSVGFWFFIDFDMIVMRSIAGGDKGTIAVIFYRERLERNSWE